MAGWDRIKRIAFGSSRTIGVRTVDPDLILPSEIPQLTVQLPTSEAIDVLISCCNSCCGFVREAALKELRSLDCPAAMPALLERLSDWVPQVREAAWKALQSLLERGYADQLVTRHEIMTAMGLKQHVDLSPKVSELIEQMLHPDVVKSVKDGAVADWVTKRRFCLWVLMREPLWHPFVVQTAAQDQDPSVWRWLARHILCGELEARDEIKRELLFDRAAIVATTMLRALELEQARAIENDIIQLAMHPSAPVRASAQFWARKLQVVELPKRVRELFDAQDKESLSIGVIAALGELGDGVEDLARVRLLMDHPRTNVREVAIQAVVRLTKDEQELDALIGAMGDSNGRVRWLAMRALMSRPRVFWFDQVSSEFLYGSNPRSKKHIAELLAKRVDWDLIPLTLRALQRDAPELRSHAFHILDAWYGKYGKLGWIRPSPKLWAEIVELWDRVEHKPSPEEGGSGWVFLRSTIELGLKDGWGENA